MPIKRRGNGSGSTKPPSDSVAIGRSRGVTGSDVTKSPSDLVAHTYQEVLHCNRLADSLDFDMPSCIITAICSSFGL